MFVLGLTSGLSSIGYSVIHWNHAELQQIDSDLLSGSRSSSSTLFSRCKAHYLILSVVLERHPPAAVALGPPVERSEPEEWVAGMREMIHSVTGLLRIPVVEFDKRGEILDVLNMPGEPRIRRMRDLLNRHLGYGIYVSDRRAELATATALAGAFAIRERAAKSAH